MATTALLDVGIGVDWSTTTVSPVFFHTTKRKRDRDNLSGSLKAARDGIADAMTKWGLVEDDTGFVPMPPKSQIDKDFPRVEITVAARPDMADVVE